MNSFTVNVVRTNGEIDTNKTLTEVHAKLSALATSERANNDEISVKVAEVFSDHPGMKSFQLGVLAAYTMQKLSVPAAEFEAIQERVKEYIRNATDLFHIAKGKGGGVMNLARLDEKELAKVTEQRAKAEKAALAVAV